jgi:hypothetical protein
MLDADSDIPKRDIPPEGEVGQFHGSRIGKDVSFSTQRRTA